MLKSGQLHRTENTPYNNLYEWSDRLRQAPVYIKLPVVLISIVFLVLLFSGYYPILPHPMDLALTFYLLIAASIGLVAGSFWIGYDVVSSICRCCRRSVNLS